MTDSNLTCYDEVKALLSLTKKYMAPFSQNAIGVKPVENASQANEESVCVHACIELTFIRLQYVYRVPDLQ